jgi:hypothetical protein
MKNVTKRVAADLQLPEGDEYTQDWAYELPGEFRTSEHLARYVAAYENPAYGDEERLVLMELMLNVANDIFEKGGIAGPAAWKQVEAVIKRHAALHRDQVEYWTVPEDELDDAFAITPLARALWSELYE